ncbi:MAG: hypothetical protein NT031_19330 [Planctomycetota bacterium]|nr:hypothetical protein [Planctomycetota bacterium]
MNIQSETHRLTLNEETGEFEVYPLTPRQLHVTEYRGGRLVRDEDETHPDAAAVKLLEFVNGTPLFAANWAGDGAFNLDLDCGLARWHGLKPVGQVRTALKRCGFSPEQVKTVIAAAKVEDHGHVRYYW